MMKRKKSLKNCVNFKKMKICPQVKKKLKKNLKIKKGKKNNRTNLKLCKKIKDNRQ